MIKNFFQPLSKSFKKSSFNKESIGFTILHSDEITEDSVAIFSVDDEYTEVRNAFYNLSNHFDSTQIVDLGVFKKTKSKRNNLAGLKEILLYLSELKAKAIILGNNAELVLAQWSTAIELSSRVDVALVVPSYNAKTADYLFQVLKNDIDKLFHISFTAHQSYLNYKSVYEFLNNFFFEELRLGEYRDEPLKIEALARETDFMAFDLSTIKNTDFAAANMHYPNGLYSEEACKICRYAGLSNKLNSISFLEVDDKKINEVSSQQLAQMMWYFIDGVENRFNDIPNTDNTNFRVLHCPIESAPIPEILFIKNIVNGRLWMQVPDGDSNRWIGCYEEDYTIASLGEIPEKWFRVAGI